MEILARLTGIRPGDHIVECDRCGREIWSSDARREWTGLIVCREDYEERNAQEFVKGRADRQAVPNPQPEPPDVFAGILSTPLTANAAGGATSLTVSSTTGFTAGHRVQIMLNNDNLHHTTIVSVDDATTLTITAGLPSAAASGKMVSDIGA